MDESGASSSDHIKEDHITLANRLKCPRGFVGWVADVNPDVRMKVYMANLSGESIDDLYFKFMGSISLECLQLSPKDPINENLKTVFFKF